MIQEMIVWILFALALGYISRLLYRNFRPTQGGCAKGCGSCALDLGKLEEALKKAEGKADA